MAASRLPPEELKRSAMKSAERLAFFIESNAPESLIGREWVILWNRMTELHGPEFFEKWQRESESLRQEIDDEDRSN